MNQALMCVGGKAEWRMRRMKKGIGGVRDGKKGAEAWRPGRVPPSVICSHSIAGVLICFISAYVTLVEWF